jgi:UDP-glucose 4-epimerase
MAWIAKQGHFMSGILVTGGAGYIGAHCCVALINAGHRPIIFDNMSNANAVVLDRIEVITGFRPPLFVGDVRDPVALASAFDAHEISAVMHLAALKAVEESVRRPLDYFDNNVRGSLTLLAAARQAGVKTFVFSSSATVYGDPSSVPVREDAPLGSANPYGRSKLIVEGMLEDLFAAEPDWRIARLRYFNPAEAHPSGRLGEDETEGTGNLMPFLSRVATGNLDVLEVFGDDYPTRDGTGVRDYIHVVDLAEGHLAALNRLNDEGGMLTVNLGTGRGYSVLEMIAAFERASGQPIPYRVVDRRRGDVAECYADVALAERLLGWTARRSLDEMCADTWRWLRSRDKAWARA